MRVTLAELVYRQSASVGGLNAQLHRVNSELDAFAYVASHDLKAPVRSIRGFAEWIVEDAGDALNDAITSHLEQIVDLTGRMDQLIESLLRYARWAGRN